jgi:hypothetical protein
VWWLSGEVGNMYSVNKCCVKEKVGKNKNSMGWMSKKVMEEKCLERMRYKLLNMGWISWKVKKKWVMLW